MSQSVSASLGFRQLAAHLLDTSGVITTPWDVVFGAGGLAALDRALTPGTGANKAAKMWYARSTLAAAGNDDWQIGAGGTNCLDRFNNPVTFTLLKWFVLRIVGAATGNRLIVGNAGANPAILWFGAVAQTEDVHDVLIKINQIDGWAVAASKVLRINNPTAGPLTYDALGLGE